MAIQLAGITLKSVFLGRLLALTLAQQHFFVSLSEGDRYEENS
jgi:hypothetical protein